MAVNGLANALSLTGQATGDIINRDPVFFLPANWVFSIWGLIYLGLTAFAAYGLLPAGRRNPRLQRIGPLFAVTCLANGAWLFLWHWERLPHSLVAMTILLLTLIGIYAALHAGRETPSRAERLCVRLPFSVYLGWISVATIANAAVVLDRAGWGGWGLAPAAWAALMIAVGGALAALVGLGRVDASFAAVFVWAFVGIAIRQRDTPFVAVAATIGASVAAAVALAALARRWRQRDTLPGRGQALGA